MPESTATAAEQFRDRQIEEYSAYVALGPIAINGVRAFNQGDPVPKTHVYNGIVARDLVGTPTTPSKADQAETDKD